jgi:hypothetical protein
MGEIDSYKTSASQPLGEIDMATRDAWAMHPVVPSEIWPGRWTDMESLERNARLYRQEERRKFLSGLFQLPGHWIGRMLKAMGRQRTAAHVSSIRPSCQGPAAKA